ncbi:MAG: hypothetical protein OXN87_14385 [Chloroflexota bacterium]|nr:hypothetical protein [Chloroflexota bacterium]
MDQAESVAEWPPLEPIWQMIGRFWKIQYGVESLLRNTLPMFTDEDWTHLTAGELRSRCQEWYRELGVSEFVDVDKALRWIKQCVANRNCVAHADLHDDGRLWAGERGQDKTIEITEQWLEIAYAIAWVTLHMISDLALAVSAAQANRAFFDSTDIPDEKLAEVAQKFSRLDPEVRAEFEGFVEEVLFPFGRPKLIAQSP